MKNVFLNIQKTIWRTYSNFLCGFRKDFNAKQCLIGMIEKIKAYILVR